MVCKYNPLKLMNDFRQRRTLLLYDFRQGFVVSKRQRSPKGQPNMNNAEKPATVGIKSEGNQRKKPP